MADPTPLDLDELRSRIKELAESRTNFHEDENLITSDEDELLRECVFQLGGKVNEIIEEYSDVSSLEAEDLDAYVENLKGELCSMEAENAELSAEIENLMKGSFEDSIRLQNNIEGLNSTMEFIQSQGLETKRADAVLECSLLEEHQPEAIDADGGCKFKLLELNSQIEKKRGMLKSLEDLDYTLKRCEDVLKIEDLLTGLKVIEYEGNRINLSLRTYIPETEMAEQIHELSIEFLDATLELKNAEIFPNDVYIGEIIDTAKSFAHQFSLVPIFENKTSLEWFVRRVQDRIILNTLRKSLVKDANKSRHSIEYIDRDEMIIGHMVDGVDAFIKPSQGWPMTTSPLKLLSLKGSTQSSKEVTFSFLCKVEEMVNSLDVKVCQNLSTFMDAIEEILKQRMRIQLQSESGSSINN
ncbi:unnamed protein product [Lactuca saligna]|uniref:Uncharacterized protein n=1 Tax=Lactuca saligna TaxID=75948 RepID=A0AA35Y3K6_LACSI|nr:unnamed protein product [Lactuca saligna]